MKKSHIIAIVIIAIAIGAIISTAGNASTYVTFTDAKNIALGGSEEKVHVVGKLLKDTEGNIRGMYYEPEKDPNFFAFILEDTNKVQMEVVFRKAKPADFEKSEQIVIIGNVQENKFVASEILMKCPSKYSEKEIKVEASK